MNYETIRAAMQQEIDEPQPYYMPCSPGEFIRDRLFKQGNWEEATWFWGAFCRAHFGVKELDELMPALTHMLLKGTMPDWGTRGT